MEKSDEPIYVTRPMLPPLPEFNKYLEQIWDSRILTNNGAYHQEFEKKLAEYLGVKYLSVFSNGTLALMVAIQALKIAGEVITTPFSFVATTHSLWWNNIKPVFVDIEPGSFNLDPKKVEAAITTQTTALMPVHVYGNPCAVDELQRIADTYGLKIIYDAAHAFGVRRDGNSILNYGDLSVMSFHATKVFNTIEGGAIVCQDEKMKQRIDYLKNFGFADEVTVVGPGINAKMNEIQAAFGLLQLKYVDEYIEKRKKIVDCYRASLSDVAGLYLTSYKDGIDYNYSYFPVLIDSKTYGLTRDDLYLKLKRNNIYSRRYFYPLISQFPIYSGLGSANANNLPVATRIAGQVICLPIYPDLSLDKVAQICAIIKN